MCFLGSTGRPKGCELQHKSVVNLVRAEKVLFQVHERDRVYQGFSIAFDASVEEVWLAFHSGACLVAATPEMVRKRKKNRKKKQKTLWTH